MKPYEHFAQTLRHSSLLSNLKAWNLLRPIYNQSLRVLYPKGIERTINGSDTIRLDYKWRNVPEDYEPQVWSAIMREIRPDDCVVDVGAYIGLYAICIAKRLTTGRVHAFEPDSQNFEDLKRHASMNHVNLALYPWAAGDANKELLFDSHHEESSVSSGGSNAVHAVTLDMIFAGERVDVIKIDTEGFEEHVLKGAQKLCSDPARRPRAIFVEVHPFAWERYGVSSWTLLSLIRRLGYKTYYLDGSEVSEVSEYGEIVLRP